jgi:hypothetical protein
MALGSVITLKGKIRIVFIRRHLFHPTLDEITMANPIDHALVQRLYRYYQAEKTVRKLGPLDEVDLRADAVMTLLGIPTMEQLDFFINCSKEISGFLHCGALIITHFENCE